MRGCVLFGKVRFANDEQNTVRKPVKAEPAPPPAKKPEDRPKSNKTQAPRRRLPF